MVLSMNPALSLFLVINYHNFEEVVVKDSEAEQPLQPGAFPWDEVVR